MSVNSKMTAIADKIRALLGLTGTMGLDAMNSNLGTAINACDSQADLIAQIKSALEGKAAGGGSGGTTSGNYGYRDGEMIVSSITNPTKELLGELDNLRIEFLYAERVVNRAFYDSSQLSEVRFLTAITVEAHAFAECVNLERARFDKATSIGENAFNGCGKLHTIDLPEATSIGMSAFDGCSLSSAHLPSVRSIDYGAFRECFFMEKINLPSATRIDHQAFDKCASLTAVILGTTEEVCVCELTALNNTPIMTGQGHIYVPTVMYEYYRAGYEATIDALMPGFFDILFRKIEDYPEICG